LLRPDSGIRPGIRPIRILGQLLRGIDYSFHHFQFPESHPVATVRADINEDQCPSDQERAGGSCSRFSPRAATRAPVAMFNITSPMLAKTVARPSIGDKGRCCGAVEPLVGDPGIYVYLQVVRRLPCRDFRAIRIHRRGATCTVQQLQNEIVPDLVGLTANNAVKKTRLVGLQLRIHLIRQLPLESVQKGGHRPITTRASRNPYRQP